MLPALKPLPIPTRDPCFSSPTSQDYSTDNTPSSSVQISPTVNLSREYTLVLKTHSYSEIRTTFAEIFSFDQNIEAGQFDICEEPQLLAKFLRPSHESVQEALFLIELKSLVHLVGEYFEHSENASRLCVVVYQRIHLARLLYRPVHNVLDSLPLDHDWDSCLLASPLCKLAFDSFLPFDDLENPFLSLDSCKFDDMCRGFSQLRQQLDHFKRSKSKHRCRNWGSCISCGIDCNVRSPLRPQRLKKSGASSRSQLEDASKGAFAVQHHLNTIDRLVVRLHSAVENDKFLIRLGLGRGMDRYSIQEMLKQLQRNWPNFVKQLEDLEEHLFLCFTAINKARSLLFDEIRMNQHPPF